MKRYSWPTIPGWNGLEEDPEGDWVQYDDFQDHADNRAELVRHLQDHIKKLENMVQELETDLAEERMSSIRFALGTEL